ncbi:hypothetical protein MIMGU_mgv11b020300mg [Erythranthe guttata]|uniref:Uncharacterized protein n=1 Tax=Erythranthe guttata TaxID=4155 RepID=A0A022Q5C8_ERYGU|nr:hypothetical protein MIMGU_mgv11b020300mg [Erythranthe guttata]
MHAYFNIYFGINALNSEVKKTPSCLPRGVGLFKDTSLVADGRNLNFITYALRENSKLCRLIFEGALYAGSIPAPSKISIL